MRRKTLILISSVVFSLTASSLLGRLAIITSGVPSSMRQGPFEATTHVINLITFLVDPVVAVLTGALVGAWGGRASSKIAALGIWPLTIMAVVTYPKPLGGLAAGAMDMFLASGIAHFTCAIRVVVPPTSES